MDFTFYYLNTAIYARDAYMYRHYKYPTWVPELGCYKPMNWSERIAFEKALMEKEG